MSLPFLGGFFAYIMWASFYLAQMNPMLVINYEGYEAPDKK